MFVAFAILSFVTCSTQAINFLQSSIMILVTLTYTGIVITLNYLNGDEEVLKSIQTVTAGPSVNSVYLASYVTMFIISIVLLVLNDLNQLILLRRRPHELLLKQDETMISLKNTSKILCVLP